MEKDNIKKSDEFDDLGHQSSFNLITLRHENELFKDEDNLKFKSIRVKRINLPKKGEDWNILQDDKIILTLKGIRFTKKEKIFLRTIKGMQFIIDGYKNGWKSITKFKSEMKDLI